MYKGRKIVCVIPARSGSKGLPGKNIRMFLGKPLIAHTIAQAQLSGMIDRIIVSTDDAMIADISKKYGAEAPFFRPRALARDTSSTMDVLRHALAWLKKDGYSFDILVLLHATAPLRSVADINNSIKLLFEKNVSNVFSVTEAHRNPYFNMVEEKRGRVALVKRGSFASRQEAPAVYDMNASIYVWWRGVFENKKKIFLKNTRIYIMPKERSVDIDDAFDLQVAKAFVRIKKGYR